ncbi:MAG: hypothetical protein IPM79_25545 [Polyangiaceae bacterium]|nr:hypothetical protein [Polyangiaceae bacterium]MBK8940890.1 hypothetical protein [Polyangiaceae bacterium]
MKVLLLVLGVLFLGGGGFMGYRYTRIVSHLEEERSAVEKAHEAFLKSCPRDMLGLEPEKVRDAPDAPYDCKQAASDLNSHKLIRDGYAEYEKPVLGAGIGGVVLGGLLVAVGLTRKKKA